VAVLHLTFAQIIIAGDSAGGNLTAAILLHSAQPHPEVTPLDFGGDSLAGAFLISPWITFDTTAQSMTRNLCTDYICLKSLSRASASFTNGVEDNYSLPLKAAAESWKGIKVKALGIVAGGYEVMLDDIVNFAEKVKVSN
jgi:acetyl esterase/lipase